jgi:hypothetical protein
MSKPRFRIYQSDLAMGYVFEPLNESAIQKCKRERQFDWGKYIGDIRHSVYPLKP